MNWEKLSEKLSRDKKGKHIMIFRDPEDANNPFILNKLAKYKKGGYRVVVHDSPKEDKKQK